MTDAQQTALERATAELHAAAVVFDEDGALNGILELHNAARAYRAARREAGL